MPPRRAAEPQRESSSLAAASPGLGIDGHFPCCPHRSPPPRNRTGCVEDGGDSGAGGKRMERRRGSEIIGEWPDDSREAAQLVIDKYGEPHEATDSLLVWHR